MVSATLPDGAFASPERYGKLRAELGAELGQRNTGKTLPKLCPWFQSTERKTSQKHRYFPHFGAWLSLVERYVRDVEVAGSNPVAPTRKNRGETYFTAVSLWA